MGDLGGSSIDYVTHGIVLYVAWFVLSFVLMLSKRYIAGHPLIHHIIHVIAGYALLIITAVMSFKIISNY